MERIDLFDKYLKNELSASEKTEVEVRLESDEDFASDFNVYLLTVHGLRKEVEQDNIEFGIAMRKLSKEQLRQVIGKTAEVPCIAKPKAIRFKPWIWQAASIAAIVVIAFTAVFRIEHNYNSQLTAYRDNVSATIPMLAYDVTRGVNDQYNINKLSDSQLKQILPELETEYRLSTDDDAIFDNGQSLGMAYLRLHEYNKAKQVFTQLINKFENNPDCKDDVAKWTAILKIIE